MLSGDWTGKTKLTIDGKVEEDTVYLSLKQTVNIVTGTAGPTLEQQSPIRNGKVEGNRIILEVPVPNGVFKFDLYLRRRTPQRRRRRNRPGSDHQKRKWTPSG